jgi:hypothetical protein
MQSLPRDNKPASDKGFGHKTLFVTHNRLFQYTSDNIGFLLQMLMFALLFCQKHLI